MKKKSKTKQILKRCLFACGVFSVVLFSCYSYALAKTTSSGSTIREKMREKQDLETEIVDLEMQYFEIINAIDQDNFTAYGLQKVAAVDYVTSETEQAQFAARF